MRRRILIMILVAVAPSTGQAKDRVVDCYLKVDRTVYLNRKCNFSPSKDGSFSMGTAPEGSNHVEPYFVYVNRNDDGSADASWNEEPSATHAQAPLGRVLRTGACWTNERARICAFTLPAGEYADLEDAPEPQEGTPGNCGPRPTSPKRE